MRRQVGATGGGLFDQPGNCCEIRTVCNLLAENLAAAGNHRENVVEVMGNAPSQLTDRLHLLGLANLRFRGFHLPEGLKFLLGAAALPAFLFKGCLCLPQLDRRGNGHNLRQQSPEQHGGDDRCKGGQRLDQAFNSVNRHPERINREHVGETARQDEDSKRPENPIEFDIAPFRDKIRQGKGDREVSDRDYRIGSDMQPNQLRLPQQANAVGRKHRRV